MQGMLIPGARPRKRKAETGRFRAGTAALAATRM